MSDKENLPNLLLVGAAKSGTTSLARALDISKDIYLSAIKEPHFHVAQEVKGKIPCVVDNLAEYRALYKEGKNHKYRLDASVLYLPLHETAISSIKKNLNKDVKIIIILRDPLDRAVSAYKHSLRFNGMEKCSFNKAVHLDQVRRTGNPMLCYRWLSEYYSQVKGYKERFDNVLVLTSSEFKNHPQRALDKVSDFLQIDRFQYQYEINDNSEEFSWKLGFLGVVMNSLCPGSIRERLRRLSPTTYNFIKTIVIRIFGTQDPYEVSVSTEIKHVFETEKVNIEKYLEIKL